MSYLETQRKSPRSGQEFMKNINGLGSGSYDAQNPPSARDRLDTIGYFLEEWHMGHHPRMTYKSST